MLALALGSRRFASLVAAPARPVGWRRKANAKRPEAAEVSPHYRDYCPYYPARLGSVSSSPCFLAWPAKILRGWGFIALSQKP